MSPQSAREPEDAAVLQMDWLGLPGPAGGHVLDGPRKSRFQRPAVDSADRPGGRRGRASYTAAARAEGAIDAGASGSDSTRGRLGLPFLFDAARSGRDRCGKLAMVLSSLWSRALLTGPPIFADRATCFTLFVWKLPVPITTFSLQLPRCALVMCARWRERSPRSRIVPGDGPICSRRYSRTAGALESLG